MRTTNHTACEASLGCLFTAFCCEGQCRSEFLIQHHIYQKGETVFRQGAVISGCYILCDGKVRLTRYTKRGSQYGVKFLGTSDFFGVPALFETKASPVEARALAESIVGWLSLGDFQELLRRYPSVAFELQKRLAREVGELYVRLAEQALLGTRGRLIQLLLELGQKEALAWMIMGVFIGCVWGIAVCAAEFLKD